MLDFSKAGLSPARVFAFCAVVAAVVTLPSLANGFTYDDVWIVERNEVIHDLDIGTLTVSPFWPEERGDVMWRPVALVGFGVQWALGSGSPFVFHLFSVLLYSAVAGLVGLLCASLAGSRVGLIAGLLFAAHPVHVEVTANVVGQAELWAALGFVAALVITWERCGETRPGIRFGLLLLTLACLAVGLGGKEQPVTYPAAALVLWWLRSRQDERTFWTVARTEWVLPALSCILIVVYLILRAELGGGVTAAGGIATGLDSDSVLNRLVVMLPVTLVWLRVLFFPLALSADYSPQHLVPELALGGNHLLAIILWVSLAVLVWMNRTKQPLVFVGCMLFAVTVSVVSNVVVPLEVLLAERLLFLPSLGWALAVAAGIEAVRQSRAGQSHSRAFTVAVTGILLLFGVRSGLRADVWRNNDVFFDTLLQDAPESFRSHWAIGHFAFERGDSALGERELITAVRLNPEHPQLLEDFGRLYASTNRYDPAIPLLSHAVEIDSSRLSAALPLALALTRTDRSAEALSVLDAMASIHGETRGLALVRGEVLMRSGRHSEAYSALVGLVEREPNVWSVRLMAAEAAFAAGLCAQALAQADTALTMAPPAEVGAIETFRATVANGNANCK